MHKFILQILKKYLIKSDFIHTSSFKMNFYAISGAFSQSIRSILLFKPSKDYLNDLFVLKKV